MPRKDLRSKVLADPRRPDQELFMAMPHDDLWIDAPRDSTILARKYIEYVQKTVN